MQQPVLSKGGSFSDTRGTVAYNNSFDVSDIKRIYIIENSTTEIQRGWQGHKIEQRWFTVANGSFEIQLIAVDNWDLPSKELEPIKYQLNATTMDILHVPAGYISSIRCLEQGAKLIAMSDYGLQEIQDEYRFDIDYFKDKG
jgi:hypothetical protein